MDRYWFGVRCVFRHDELGVFEERVTLWRAESPDAAIALAETEAETYAEDVPVRYLGLAQSFAMFDEPEHGAEIFSLMRTSDLPDQEYLDQFFNTGEERQNGVGDGSWTAGPLRTGFGPDREP